MPFQIACQICRAAFSIDDELFERRVAGKRARFRCPRCQQRSEIDRLPIAAPQGELEALPRLGETDLIFSEADVAELSDDEVASLPPESIAAVKAARPKPKPRLESKVDDELWVVSVKEGVEDQEIFESSLIDLIASGKMPPDAIVWREGIENWIPLADVPELAKHLPPHTDDKTGGFLGTGMQVSFGSNAGERKSAPPPLPPKKRSYGSAKKKSYGGEGRAKPVALSPGFLFSVDDAESEPPQAVEEPRKGSAKLVPKPPLKAPRRAVTRDLDFSDIAEDEIVPSSGAPALRDLTLPIKGAEPATPAPAGLFSSLGGTEEEVLGPPSIDISDLGQSNRRIVEKAPEPEPPAASTAPASKRAKQGRSKRPPAPVEQPVAEDSEPRQRAAQNRPHAGSGDDSLVHEIPEQRGWFTPGRVVVLLAIAALAYFLFSRQMQQTAQQTLPAPTATELPELAAERPVEPTPPSVPEAAPPTPEPSAVPEAPPVPQEAASAPAPPARPAGATGPTARGTTGEAAAPTAREETPKLEPKPEPKPEPRPEPTPANPDAPVFNKDAAVAALNTAVAQASGCRQEGDPSGTARVVVTFAPSGRVTSANLSGPPFAGTRTGGCIASTMRRAKIPAFSGTHVTVAKSVVIR